MGRKGKYNVNNTKKWTRNFALSNIALFFTITLISSVGFAADRTVSVMTYNVENLFDTEHDEGKNDWAYLPRSQKQSREFKAHCEGIDNSRWRRECLELNWSQEVFKAKARNLGRAIKSSFGGNGPDILVLQEVENLKALQGLHKHGLAGMGYESVVLLEGPDLRGIDTAIISKLPLVNSTSHTVHLPGNVRPTRDVLEATFAVNGKHLTVYSNHWPSQSNPSSHRVAAAKTLVKAAKIADDRGELVIALGDFNSKFFEITGAVGDVLRGGNEDSPIFVDGVETRLEEYREPRISMPGTYLHRTGWNYLDRVFILNNSFDNGLDVNWTSIDVHAPSFMLDRGRPMKFKTTTQEGFSDHLPLVVEFIL